MFSGGTLISADNAWMLWAIMFALAAISVWAEQTYKWAAKVTGPLIGLVAAIILANTHVIPYSSPTYDAIMDYLVPIAIVMLLFRADVKSIVKDTGKMFLCFNISAVGTLIGSLVAFFAMRSFLPELDKMAGVLTGSYIGGGVNLFAVANSTDLSETMLSAEVVADNLVMTLCFLACLWIPTSKLGRKHYPHPFQDALDAKGDDGSAKTMAAAYWGAKEISFLDIAMTSAIAIVIAGISAQIADLLGSTFSGLLGVILGNHYVILTVITVTIVSLFPNYFKNLKGAQEIGTFLMYVFFVVIGCPADLKSVIVDAPLLLVFCAIIVIINMLVTLGFGKIFKLNVEELAISIVAAIGGPSDGACISIAKGYGDLVIPAILVGLWGYIIGTPLGLIMADFLSKYTIL